MSIQDLLPAIRPVVAEFDRLGIPYYIGGGSVASSLYGEPRSTLDVDIGAVVNNICPRQRYTTKGTKFHEGRPEIRF